MSIPNPPTHNYGSVWGSVNSGPGTQYNFQGQTINVTVQHLETARKVAQHQPRRDPVSAVGRASELSVLSSELQHHPCVAITGVGGIGKSTLAALLGADPAAYTHRCWRNLGETATDLSAFIQAALATLGLSFDPREMPQPAEQAEYLAQILHDNPTVRLLIVLDNFESVIAPDGNLALGWADLLDRAAHNFGPSRLLITSRELPHLPQGQEPRRYTLPGLNEADGLALLRQLGVSADPTDLAAAITRSGGHPLALRFLADLITNEGYTLARLLHEPIWDERIAERLLDKIYQSLPLDQQQTLQYFSLFDRPTTPATIAGILANLPHPPQGWNEQTIRRHATALATRSLLDATAGRYTSHPIVRTYAYNLIPNPSTLHIAAAFHSYLEYEASGFNPDTKPPRELAAIQPLIDAFDHYVAAGEYKAAAVVMMGTCMGYLTNRSEGQDNWITLNVLLSRMGELVRLAEMLEHLVNAPTNSLDNDERSSTLGNLGVIYARLDEHDKAMDCFNLSLELAEQLDDETKLATALCNMGSGYNLLSKYKVATEYFNRSLEIAENLNHQRLRVAILTNLGISFNGLKDFNEAIECHQQALRIAIDIGDEHGQASNLASLGNVYISMKDYQKAIKYFSECLDIMEQLGDVDGQGGAWRNLGAAYGQLGRYFEGLVCSIKSLIFKVNIGNEYAVQQTLSNIDYIHGAYITHMGEEAWPKFEGEALGFAADPTWRPSQPPTPT